ncbi:hypothetical protein SISNIDRAFT_471178 [Sistotremastrum niveocremeum HHB9708]|uniref:DUF6535 domain-containing protein n=1 Tax=Sistotremastrum niveocremeum HHB9708 TaxID=1314777 RepID=A0A164MXW7_9AGAM|nr:hypothetical protein SISNIDRAFT_471178 [Sistotremastrum niveocremeum HHB9708]
MAAQPSENRPAGPVRPSSMTRAPPASLSSLETKFDKLLSLIEKQTAAVEQQNMMMEKQHTAIEKELKDHGEKLETIRKDVVKNDQPYEVREVEDQQTWGGLCKEAVTITKESVGEWTTLMNVSLVFNAIFLAIVTAFIVPVLQDLQTPTATDATGSFDPHRQEVIEQWIAFFQISAFSLSVFNSALCVLGTQWGARLITRIQAKDSHTTAIHFERRKRSGKKWLLRLTGLLFLTLLLSILLFMSAFLMQAWIVAYVQPEPRPILIAAAAIVSVMVLTILIIVGVTTLHAVRWENSPFETPLSTVLRLLLRKEPPAEERVENVEDLLEVKEEDAQPRFYEIENGLKHAFHPETLKLYAAMVMNTTETDVLEKAVPSFRFTPWLEVPDGLFRLFEGVFQRFMATDTSIRVKETVDHHFLSFGRFLDRVRRRADSSILRWYRKQCEELCSRSHESHDKYFTSFVAVASVRERNEDLRKISKLSYKECMGQVLASYDPRKTRSQVGDRLDVYESAVARCNSLLRDGKEDNVTEITSGQHSSILISYVHGPLWNDRSAEFLIRSIVRGRELNLLRELADFLSDPGVIFFHQVVRILTLLMPEASTTFSVPGDFDLTRALFCLFRTDPNPYYWGEQSATLLFYLDHGAFDKLSDFRSALVFFQSLLECLKLSDNDRTTLISDLCVFARKSRSRSANVGPTVTKFVDAFDRCRVHLLLDVPILISAEDRSEILRSLIRNPVLDWWRIELFVSRMKWSDSDIWDTISHHTNIADTNYVRYSLLPLNFLCLLKTRRYALPHNADLSPLITCMIGYSRFRRNIEPMSWRTDSNTLMHYISQGNAFDRVAAHDVGRRSARTFFNLCAGDKSDNFYNYRYHTSDETRDQAKKYLKRLDLLESNHSSEPTQPSRSATYGPSMWTAPRWFTSASRAGNGSSESIGLPSRSPHTVLGMETISQNT